MKIDEKLTTADLRSGIELLWDLSAQKVRAISKNDSSEGTPVFTVSGKYTSRGWTEWTQGFQFGSEILQFDATGETRFLETGRAATLNRMAPHLTHVGVHDHGFNNVSTYGNLWRLMNEGRIEENPWERKFYELALKVSAAVQARRWTDLGESGFIYSFNGPHSLFADTIRSLRILALGHLLGHRLMEEGDRVVSLLERLVQHAKTTAEYTVYYGHGRDDYDVRGRVAHESIFNLNDGSYRNPSTQQGYSPFSTWTRGLAWVICGYAEQLEFLSCLGPWELDPFGGQEEVRGFMLAAAEAAADFYIENTPTDGIPYWDTGAPGLSQLANHLDKPADPENPSEPVDSSAAVIAAQGMLRLGRFLSGSGNERLGSKYWQAGLTIVNSVFEEPYLSVNEQHQGLILHSIYHRPQGWDYVPGGSGVPRGESSMWGDYHAREVALYLQRVDRSETYLTFFGP